MLPVSPAASDGCCGGESEFLATSCGLTVYGPVEEDFPEFVEHGDLLDIIDFDDLLGDVLPDLEIDPQILAGDHMNASSTITTDSQGENKGGKGEEVVSKRDDAVVADSNRKSKYSSSLSSKTNQMSSNKQGKRKVDWTPELHRRFVEAVEQLGVEKAVPSRILELMGVRCLTRHNVASHLQKYRSHRKHLIAREAEAANWTRRRHSYGLDKQNGWLAPAPPPAIGFPPPPPPPPSSVQNHHHFRPLHVWGHPTVDHVCPKHLPPPFRVSDSLYWPGIHNPYMSTVATRFKAPMIAGIQQALPPYHTMYKPDIGFGGTRPPLIDLHPSKESVDAAIGDVLKKPWLPLPLGLKPPAVEGVMTELHRHGVSKVPPTASCA